MPLRKVTRGTARKVKERRMGKDMRRASVRTNDAMPYWPFKYR